MLVEFRIENFRSYADEQVFSFVAGQGRNHPNERFSTPGFRNKKLLRTAMLLGPNGGGKSNLLRGLKVLRQMVLDSAAHIRPGDPLPMVPFRMTPKWAEQPTMLEVSFVHPVVLVEGEPAKPVHFQYGFKATTEQVLEEWLYAYPHGPAQRWFVREGDELSPGRSLTGEKKGLIQGVHNRPNALALSMGAQLGHPLLKQVWRWFQDTLHVMGSGETMFDAAGGNLRVLSGRTTAQMAYESQPQRTRIAKLLRHADTGIRDLQVEKRERRREDLPPDLLPKLFMDQWLSEPEYVVHTVHEYGGVKTLQPLREESEGTNHLFCLAGPWLNAMDQGYVLAIDDLFSNLHPLLSRALVEARPPESKAQILVVTHDTTLLDHALLRRDQFWLVEKSGETGASSLFSLEEFRTRNDKRLQKAYLGGQFGGLPMVEGFMAKPIADVDKLVKDLRALK